MIKKTANTVNEFYEDWKKEVISWNAGGSVDDYDESLTPQENIENIRNKVERGTRASLGMDDSIEYYIYLQKVRLELIESGGIKDVCISCRSVDTTFNKDTWTCNKCKQTWNPLRLIYRGM